MSKDHIKYQTSRATVLEMEELLGKAIPLLDHGFIRVVDYMGDDSAIVQAARVSYGSGTKSVKSDRALIRYLLSHRHTSPFEMCEIKLHVKVPIFIARQWVRHRTANINEYSARYSLMDKEYYVPELDNISVQSSDNKQGRGDNLKDATGKLVQNIIQQNSDRAYEVYSTLLNINDSGDKLDEQQQGVAREIARTVLPVNMYTQFYWKVDLHNLLHFLSLRIHPHAQYEIRVYANLIADIVKKWLPVTYEAFEDYRLGMVELSAKSVEALKRILNGENVHFEDSGLTKREFESLKGKFNI